MLQWDNSHWFYLLISSSCSLSFQTWWVWSEWWRNSGCPRPTWSWKKWSSRWPVATATPSTTGTLSRWCWGSARPCSNCESARVDRMFRLFTAVCKPWALLTKSGRGWVICCSSRGSTGGHVITSDNRRHSRGALVVNLHSNKIHLCSLSIVSPSLSWAGIMCLANWQEAD